MKISFGTLFKVNKEAVLGKDRTDVVVDVGEENYFYAAQTFRKEGKSLFLSKQELVPPVRNT